MKKITLIIALVLTNFAFAQIQEDTLSKDTTTQTSTQDTGGEDDEYIDTERD